MSRLLTLLFIATLAPTVVSAQEAPLFQSAEPMRLILEFPVDTLLRQKMDFPVVDGVLRFKEDSGKEVEIVMSMTTRGKSRLKYCSFPPLTLNLKRKQAKDTVFDGQNKLKVVTHCKNGSAHLRYLHQEYGIYRAFNVISGYSYRVRMLRIIYRDTDGKRKDEERDAFFIEPHNQVARRHEMERLRVAKVRPEQLDGEQAATYALFQYLIANTDWSMLQGPGEDGCCHNGKVIIKPQSQEHWIVLPYDFDQAGLINTKYAMPSEVLGIRSVRQRLYRGRCQHNDRMPAAVEIFNAKREEIETAIIPEGLSKSAKRSSLKYVDDFYDTVNNPKRYEKYIVDACLGKRT